MVSEKSQIEKEKYYMISLYVEPKNSEYIEHNGGYQVVEMGTCWSKDTKLQSCRMNKDGELKSNVMIIVNFIEYWKLLSRLQVL